MPEELAPVELPLEVLELPPEVLELPLDVLELPPLLITPPNPAAMLGLGFFEAEAAALI